MATRDQEQSSKRLADNLKDAESSIRRINAEASDLNSDFNAMNATFKEFKKNAGDFAGELKGADDIMTSLATRSRKLTGFTVEQLKNKKKAADFDNARLENESDIAAINGKIAELNRKKLAFLGKEDDFSKKQVEKLNKYLETLGHAAQKAGDMGKMFQEIVEANDKLNKNTAFFDALDNFTKNIPLIGGAFGEFSKASKEIRQNLGTGILETSARALLSIGSKAAIAGVAKGLVAQNTQITSIARNLNIGRKEATAFRDDLVDFSVKSGKPIGYLLEGIDSVNESLGTSGLISLDSAKQFSTLTHRLGLTNEEAASLFNAASATNQTFRELNSNLIGNVKELNAVNNAAIDYKQIMKDISGFSNAALLTQSKFAGSLVKAAYTARRLGLEMSTLESISGNLLDFETSIASELEAELLTGRQLNLETARLAALKGDLTKVALELEKQGINDVKFGKMNVLQQEAIAKAMGMSREEMATMFAKQKQLEKVSEQLGIKNLEKLSHEEQVAAIMEKQNVDKAKALELLGEQELAEQQLNRDAATAMKDSALVMTEALKGDKLNKTITAGMDLLNKNMDKAVLAMQGLAAAGMLYYGGRMIGGLLGMGGMKGLKMPKMGGIKNMFSFGSKAAPSAVKTVAAASPFAVKAFSSTASAVAPTAAKALPQAVSTVAPTAVKAVGKTAGKSIGKSLLKKIPVVGALAGIGFGLSRAMKGDFTGAIGEVASGAASLIPGIGTGVSVAIDAGLAARDIYKGTSRSDESISQAATDASTKSEKAARTQEELLKENRKLNLQMERMLQRETNILMDGAKVGSMIYKSTYKN